MPEMTDIGGTHKCAYEQCECQVSTLNTYCSDYCSDADDAEEVEMQCDCKHAPCSLADEDSLPVTTDEAE